MLGLVVVVVGGWWLVGIGCLVVCGLLIGLVVLLLFIDLDGCGLYDWFIVMVVVWCWVVLFMVDCVLDVVYFGCGG